MTVKVGSEILLWVRILVTIPTISKLVRLLTYSPQAMSKELELISCHGIQVLVSSL